MPDWAYYALAMAAVAMLRPLFWTVTISTSLWVGRQFLSERAGRRVFGHWWAAGKRGSTPDS